MKRILNFALILVSFILWTDEASAYSFIGTANDSQTLETTSFYSSYDGTFGVQSDYGSTAPVNVQLALSFELTADGGTTFSDNIWAQANARWNTDADGTVNFPGYSVSDQYNLYSDQGLQSIIQNLLFTFTLTPGTFYDWHMDVEVNKGTLGGSGSALISYDFLDLPTETSNGAAPVPEPSTILLLGFGVGIIATARKWFHK